MSNLGNQHWEAIKWILRYLRGIIGVGLIYEKCPRNEFVVKCFKDIDFGGDLDTKKITEKLYFHYFGESNSCKATLQHVIAQSTTKSEYIALIEPVKEVVWMKEIVNSFDMSM